MPSSASCERGSLPSRSVPARDWRLRIEDILAAVERVQRYTAGMDLASFLADEKTVDAVSFCFGVSASLRATFQKTWSPPIPTCHGRRCAPCGTSWSTNTLALRRRRLEDSTRRPPGARRATASLAGRSRALSSAPGIGQGSEIAPGLRDSIGDDARAIRVVLDGSPHPLKRPSAMAVHGTAPVATNCCAASPPWSRHGATTTASVARRLARASCWRNQVICAAAARSLASEQDRLVLTFVCLSLRGISS